MKLKRRTRVVGEIYTASLNDIMFFLLLFFLITSTLATPNVLKLLLPSAKSSSQSVKHPLTISVTSDLQYAINNTSVPQEQLEEILRASIQGQTDPTALLKVDKSVQVQNLVDLLDVGNRLRIKMVLATQTSKQ
ncbi:MAG: biopolymer transporter ExbD [Bacteroidetes bacterium]|nr:MAG: biopolymer transporter ExbD [Bacteroidota bacterium]REK03545.1 MAG: biopolymer transporter ExbD [Bacteroidota bacterium]REK34848.1 MAG: biopolymer transporter ExbD [Bacteroidota bacterium]REK51219.1 MAG: biopolymer transporter ExbD [Bacteroidota bacterium]